MPSSSPMIGVHPLLWNAKEYASAVVVAILQHLIPAMNEILKKDGESAEDVLILTFSSYQVLIKVFENWRRSTGFSRMGTRFTHGF